MTSQTKFKLVILIFVALLVLGGAGLFAVYRFYPNTAVVNQNGINQNTNTVSNGNGLPNTNEVGINTNAVNVNVPVGGEPLPDEDRVLALGRSFTERYGSFSNQNEFENLERLMIYMTAKLQTETNELIASQEGKDNSVYFGVTTDVVSLRLDKLEEKRAVVVVATRRRESKEGSATKVFSQTARIVLVKDSGEWLVDKFEWQ
ncbi:MAG: hypothetical protein AAB558_02340 [Patescibacteria group bacterium]